MSLPRASARILVVEDNLLIAMDLASMVRDLGCAVIGPVGQLEKALDAARQTELDAAILDIHLDGERIWPVAQLLEQRRVPMVLASGYSDADVPERFRSIPLLPKPVTPAMLQVALAELGVIRG